MSWRTNKMVLWARNTGRTLGLNKRIAVALGGGYEERYDSSFSSALRSGDCVWDVGANVGYYTRIFSERIGSQGNVFAFEPSPINVKRLVAATHGMKNVKVLRIGLGTQDGRMAFEQGTDDLGATSRVVEAGANGAFVDIRTGEGLIASGEAMPPNAIKIDVEGYELEVLKGLGRHLEAVSLRTIGVEVHFRILKDRGIPEAPGKIELLLRQAGFMVKWPDSSHIIATRTAQ